MPDDPAFNDFIRRVRAGDAAAAEALVKQYGEKVRREARARTTDPRLRQVFDSVDICQSVLGSFFAGAAAGQFELNRPDDLVHLLAGMARNKVAHQARKQRAARRDVRKSRPLDLSVFEPPASDPSPSQAVAGADLFAAFRQKLTEEERELADRRAKGESWEQVADAMGGTVQGRRKQLERAIARVTGELGLNNSKVE
ncbi:MAG TPA: sigma-70 family RNA polymerase sigma factor [Gemmataceae bacterium]|nr:sigma-70 family RNA polymerase sigma factor [Gemmataceae bacterium]